MSRHDRAGSRERRRASGTGLLILTAGLLLPAAAQVGPGRENVKPVGPSKTNIRKPPRRPGPKRPVEQVRIRPIVRANPDLVAARNWQDEELKALRSIRQAKTLLSPSRADLIAYPVEPELPRPPAPELSYRQRATLIFTREDGQPLDSRLVRIASPGFETRLVGGQVQLDGAAEPEPAGDVKVTLPPDYAFVSPGDARISFKDTPGEETRQQLEVRPAAPATGGPDPMPLFRTELEKTDSLQRVSRPVPSEPLPPAVHPTPAAATLRAVMRLIEAHRFLGPTIPVSPTASADARRAAWNNLQESVRLLNSLEGLLQRAQNETNRFATDTRARALLGDGFQDTRPELLTVLATIRSRRALHRAEALWWLASCEGPIAADRRAAIAAAEAARAADRRSVEAIALASRMIEVSEREAALRERIAAGFYRPRPAVRTLVARHLTRTITVRRTVADIRFAKAELLPGDVITVGGDPARPIAFALQGDFWRAQVPVPAGAGRAAAAGTTLRITRKSKESDLEADASLPALNPYATDGNEVNRGPFRLLALRSYHIAGEGLNQVDVLDELDPADEEGSHLREPRRRAARNARATGDGGWWVSGDDSQLLFRLRPSPYPTEPEGRTGGSFTNKVGGFFRKVTGRSGNRGVTGRVIVDAARFEGPSAGHVAGVRVGASDAAVENALGGVVPRNGVARYASGAVEIGLRAGQVEYIEIYRDLGELLGAAMPGVEAGTVTEIRHEANRLRARVGPDFPAQPGTEFVVWVAGRPLDGRGEQYRAIVLDSAKSEVVCKLVRKNSKGGVAGDADWDVLRSLPAGDAGVVVLRRPEPSSTP